MSWIYADGPGHITWVCHDDSACDDSRPTFLIGPDRPEGAVLTLSEAREMAAWLNNALAAIDRRLSTQAPALSQDALPLDLA